MIALPHTIKLSIVAMWLPEQERLTIIYYCTKIVLSLMAYKEPEFQPTVLVSSGLLVSSSSMLYTTALVSLSGLIIKTINGNRCGLNSGWGQMSHFPLIFQNLGKCNQLPLNFPRKRRCWRINQMVKKGAFSSVDPNIEEGFLSSIFRLPK